MGSAISGVIFCLEFSPSFFFFLWVPLPGVFPLVIYLFILAMVPTLRFPEQDGEP